MRAYHGTSSTAAGQIMAESHTSQPVYIESNVSLGGAYLTSERGLAEAAARAAACAHESFPVVFVLEIDERELLPDEDWIVRPAESPEDIVLGRRIQSFLDDAFEGYPGEGHSLSDHYASRYNELNARHGITWRDSWRWCRTARLSRLLRPGDVVSREDIRS